MALQHGRSIAPIEDGVDHVRGPAAAPLVLMYGDYECPYTRKAFRATQRVERLRAGGARFAFRHFPLTDVHPHALAAARAAEAAGRQGEFWRMHELLLHCQSALADGDLVGYACQLDLDVAQFERDRGGDDLLARVERDRSDGVAAGISGTPTLFIDGGLYHGPYDTATLLVVTGMTDRDHELRGIAEQ
jgi:protein-disulfide isomerase